MNGICSLTNRTLKTSPKSTFIEDSSAYKISMKEASHLLCQLENCCRISNDYRLSYAIPFNITQAPAPSQKLPAAIAAVGGTYSQYLPATAVNKFNPCTTRDTTSTAVTVIQKALEKKTWKLLLAEVTELHWNRRFKVLSLSILHDYPFFTLKLNGVISRVYRIHQVGFILNSFKVPEETWQWWQTDAYNQRMQRNHTNSSLKEEQSRVCLFTHLYEIANLSNFYLLTKNSVLLNKWDLSLMRSPEQVGSGHFGGNP